MAPMGSIYNIWLISKLLLMNRLPNFMEGLLFSLMIGSNRKLKLIGINKNNKSISKTKRYNPNISEFQKLPKNQ